jgi:hypothetical protein
MRKRQKIGAHLLLDRALFHDNVPPANLAGAAIGSAPAFFGPDASNLVPIALHIGFE